MFRALLSRLGLRSGSNAGEDGRPAEGDTDVGCGDADRDGADDGTADGFLRSRLDASVLFAHGIRSRPELERADVEDRARELEDRQRALEARHREFEARRRDE